MNKICPKCKKSKSLLDFSPSKLAKNGRTSTCKPCRALEEKNRRKKQEYKDRIRKYKQLPENKRRTKDLALKRLFNISIEDFEEMLKQQDNKCAICFRLEVCNNIKTLSVDHCHDTGKVRGLLCTNCNQGIGHFFDDITRLTNAINYLNKARNS